MLAAAEHKHAVFLVDRHGADVVERPACRRELAQSLTELILILPASDQDGRGIALRPRRQRGRLYS